MHKYFKIYEKQPDPTNKFYILKSKGGYSECCKGNSNTTNSVLPNCVGYACGRFNEIISEISKKSGMRYPYLNCNAENFIERAKTYKLEISNKPEIGGILVFQKGKTLNSSDGAGHVMIVEDLNSDTILISESNWSIKSPITRSRIITSQNNYGLGSHYKFRGCIVNPEVKRLQLLEEKSVNNEQKTEPKKDTLPQLSDKELLNLVRRTIRGDFGNGQERIKKLGTNYKTVQNQVNLNLKDNRITWNKIKLFK